MEEYNCIWRYGQLLLLVLSLVHVAGNNREQICLGALYIHQAQQMGKAAELIDRKKMRCFIVTLQDMERDTS